MAQTRVNDPYTLYYKGVAMIKEKRVGEAAGFFATILRQHRNSIFAADAAYQLGVIAESMNNPDDMMQYYMMAQQIDPKHKASHLRLGIFFISKNFLDKAEEQSKMLDRICPSGCREASVLKNALMAKLKKNDM
ncbi:MAG: hypothetical protein ACOYK8_09835 [Alphaproteobacteria bacterium]